MKIGILTLPLHTNYGGILQAYALQTVLERMGHEVFVLNKENKIRLYGYAYLYIKRIIKKIFIDRHTLIFLERERRRNSIIACRYTKKFIDDNVHIIEVKRWRELKEKGFDAIVVGSDQIWRPKYCVKIEDSFLGFTTEWNIKRISYAASFGVDNWEYSKKETKICRKLITLFSGISVRESSAVGLCKKHFDVDAIKVLDPTLLLSKDDYNKLIKSKIKENGNYVFSYILDNSQILRNMICKIANKISLSNIEGNKSKTGIMISKDIQPPVEDFLSGIKNSVCVITDSFHACIFAMLYEKPFIVIANNDRGMSRVKSLLEQFDQNDRLISADDIDSIDYSLLEKPVIIEPFLHKYRQSSLEFLVGKLK